MERVALESDVIPPVGIGFAPYNGMIRTLPLIGLSLVFLLTTAFAQTTAMKDDYWGGNSGKHLKDSLGLASNVTGMEVVADDEKITVTIKGPFFHNYVHHIKGAHKTPPGDLYISSAGWKVKGKAPYANDTFTKDEGWDYVVSLFDKAVYKLDWSKIEWTRPKPGSVIYRRDQAWRGGYGGFVSWADINLTDKSLVISFPLNPFLMEVFPASDQGAGTSIAAEDTGEDGESDNFLTLGLHWTMMCGNDVIEGEFALPATVFAETEESEEIPIPRPTTWAPPPDPQLVPWGRSFAGGTVPLIGWNDGGGGGGGHHDVPEPSLILLLLTGLSAIPFFSGRGRRK
jgi:hypothetical protein